jgi:hypothetical protein
VCRVHGQIVGEGQDALSNRAVHRARQFCEEYGRAVAVLVRAADRGRRYGVSICSDEHTYAWIAARHSAPALRLPRGGPRWSRLGGPHPMSARGRPELGLPNFRSAKRHDAGQTQL